MNEIHYSSANSHWLTPTDFLGALKPLGPIRLDPCCHPLAPINARERWSLLPGNRIVVKDGLTTSWEPELVYTAGQRVVVAPDTAGWVFVNPPYGRELARWASKIAYEAAKGVEIVALVPSRTDTQWWRELHIDWWCAWEGRITFLEPTESAHARYLTTWAKKHDGPAPPKEFIEVLPGLVSTDPAPFPCAVLYFGKRWGLFSNAMKGYGRVYRKGV